MAPAEKNRTQISKKQSQKDLSKKLKALAQNHGLQNFRKTFRKFSVETYCEFSTTTQVQHTLSCTREGCRSLCEAKRCH